MMERYRLITKPSSLVPSCRPDVDHYYIRVRSGVSVTHSPLVDRVYEVYTYGSQISNFAKPTSNWFKKKVARGKSWQYSHNELQNIKF